MPQCVTECLTIALSRAGFWRRLQRGVRPHSLSAPPEMAQAAYECRFPEQCVRYRLARQYGAAFSAHAQAAAGAEPSRPGAH